jgi:predicted dehydrogenase
MHLLVDGILQGKAPTDVRPNFDVGLAVQRVMDAVERSAATGQWVELDQ